MAANDTPMAAQLPFTQSGIQNMNDLDALIREIQNGSAPQNYLNQARDSSYQDAARYGLQGPLAATLASQSQNQVNSFYAQQRAQMLSQLLGQRGGLVLQNQQAEAQRRQEQYQMAMQQAQARAAQINQLIGLGSNLAGGFAAYKMGQGGAPAARSQTNYPSVSTPQEMALTSDGGSTQPSMANPMASGGYQTSGPGGWGSRRFGGGGYGGGY